MTECQTKQMIFPFYRSKALTVNFKGGDISSDGGLLFIRQIDQELGISKRIAELIDDCRDRRYTVHEMHTLIRQRLYQLIAGYEDCNDATTLRRDPIFKISCDRSLDDSNHLASQPTLSRFENSLRSSELYGLSELLIELFILQYDSPPQRLVLDVDPTDDPAHGAQQLALFNGFYDQHMFFPLLIYEGTQGDLLAAVLRAGNAHSAHGVLTVLSRLIERLRAKWPNVEIIIRADAGFAVPGLYEFCEEHQLGYIIGLITNERLKALNAKHLECAHLQYEKTKTKVRTLYSAYYQARSWSKCRRIIIKTEITDKGENQRFVVTNLSGSAEYLYDTLYTARGEVENTMIKELKLDLKADRLSCHRFAANQFRLLLHAFAYVLMSRLRQRLHGTELEGARIETLRLKLIKVAARVRTTVRRIWVELASGYPWKQLWHILFSRLQLAYPNGRRL